MASRGHAADVARQREEVSNAFDQFIGQLAPGSQEAASLQTAKQRVLNAMGSGLITLSDLGITGLDPHQAAQQIGTQALQQQQARIAAGGPATPLEARTDTAFQGIRKAAAPTPDEQDIANALQGLTTTTPFGSQLAQMVKQGSQTGEQAYAGISPTAASLAQTVQDRLTNTPQYTYEDTFGPQFELAKQTVEANMARRGIGPSSGLTFEQLGRTGVDLALAQANARLQLQQANQGLKQQAISDASGLVGNQQAVSQLGRQNALGVYGLGQDLRTRQLGVENAATNLQAGRESGLTNILATQGARTGQNMVNLLQNQTDYQQQLADIAANQQAANRAGIGSLLGAGTSIALAGPTGGASLYALPVLSQAGASALGGRQTGSTPTVSNSFLDQWRVGNAQANAKTQPYYGQSSYHGQGYNDLIQDPKYAYLKSLYGNG